MSGGYIANVEGTLPWDEALRGRRLWVTGGRGFIGSALVALARDCGADVRVFDADVRDDGAVRDDVLSFLPDVIVHLAARVDVTRDPVLRGPMQDVIVRGARHVREAAHEVARQHPVQVVLVGTCEEYGSIAAPFAESDVPSDPVSPYAEAKLVATREALADDGPAGLVVARPFLTYGPGQRPRQLIPALIEAALDGRSFPMTAGLQTREVNYVDDTAIGLLRAATTPEAAGRVVNVGGGEELTVADLARRVMRLAGADPGLLRLGALPTRAGEVARFCSDPSLCRSLLGHAPRVSLDEGLRRTIAHARALRATRGEP